MNALSERIWWAVRPLWYWRLLRLALRSFWLATGLAVAGWLLSRALGGPLPGIAWVAAGFALFMVLMPTLVLWPIPSDRLAERLDQAFGFRDRLATAYEVAQRQPANYVEARLLRSADGLLQNARQRLQRHIRIPWADLALSVLALVALFAVYWSDVSLRRLTLPPEASQAAQPPPLAEEPQINLPGLPPEMQGGSAPNPAPEAGQAMPGMDPGAAQQALEALADALSEQSVTQGAATALDQGDAQQAANELRELAGAAEQLSEETRQQLAESLRAAAEESAEIAPEAAQQMAEAAGQLGEGGDAAEALESLADLVEALEAARNGPVGSGPGGEGAGAGGEQNTTTERESQPAGSVERLQAEGETVELPPGELSDEANNVLQPPQGDSEATEQRDTPFTQGGASGSGGDQPADPLYYPWRWRDVIQRYFSPP